MVPVRGNLICSRNLSDWLVSEQNPEEIEFRIGKPWSGVEMLGKNTEQWVYEEVSSVKVLMWEILK